MALYPGSLRLFLVVSAANIAAFLSGTSIAWSSPILAILSGSDLTKNPLDRIINDEEFSWVGSLGSMGGILGPPLFGFTNQRFGRKLTIALIGFPFLVAYAISAFAQTVELFYVARILMGMGVGGAFCTLPVYVAEISENANRGFLQATTSTCIMTGILFSYCVGPYVSIMIFNLILSAICVVFFPIFWYAAPESPYVLLSKNQEKQAWESLLSLRQNKEIQQEFDGIKDHVKVQQPGSYLDIFKTKVSIKALFYSTALITFQQLSGVTVIIYFTQNIFDATGSDLPPEVCSIIVGSAQLLVSSTSPPFLDRVGRKLLLYIAVSGSVVAEMLLGIYFYLQENGSDVSHLSWLPVCSLVMFIGFYNFGMDSIPWAVMGEILPINIMSKGAVVVTSFYWVVGFFLTNYFKDLSDEIGMAGSFWLFAGFGVLFVLFVFGFMFETKGKSLKEIEEILEG